MIGMAVVSATPMKLAIVDPVLQSATVLAVVVWHSTANWVTEVPLKLALT